MQQFLVQGLPNCTATRMITIREACSDDTPHLEKLFLEARQDTFTWENPDKFKIEDFQRSTIGEVVFLAEDDKQILGFISIMEYESPAFIHHLFVTKPYRRQGIGGLLIQSIISLIPPPYQLKCFVRNENGVGFYLKNGWYILDRGFSQEGEYFLFELS